MCLLTTIEVLLSHWERASMAYWCIGIMRLHTMHLWLDSSWVFTWESTHLMVSVIDCGTTSVSWIMAHIEILLLVLLAQRGRLFECLTERARLAARVMVRAHHAWHRLVLHWIWVLLVMRLKLIEELGWHLTLMFGLSVHNVVHLVIIHLHARESHLVYTWIGMSLDSDL